MMNSDKEYHKRDSPLQKDSQGNMKRDLSRLVEHGALTGDQIQQLAKAGVHTCLDLVELVRDKVRCQGLGQRPGIPEDRLLLAAAAANLLALEGPGAYIAEGWVTKTTWENIDLQNADLRDIVETLAAANRQKLLEWLGTEGLDYMRVSGRQTHKRSERRSWWLVGLFLLAGMGWAVVHEWSRLFPPPTVDVGCRIAQLLERHLALAAIGFLSLFLVGVLGLVFTLKIFSSLSERISDRVGRRVMSNRDNLIVAEAMLRLPAWARLGVSVINRAYEILTLTGILFIGLLLFSGCLDLVPLLFGVLNIILVGGGYLFIFYVQVMGFRQLKSAWAAQVRAHFASYMVTQTLISIASIIAGILLFGFVFIGIGLETMTNWGIKQAEHSEVDFNMAIAQEISEVGARDEWHAWGRERVSDWVEMLAYARQTAHDCLSQGFKVLNSSYLGILFAVAVTEFLYVNHSKGVSSLCIWLISFLASEFAPDWVEQWMNLAPAVTRVSILALGTSVILAIIGEFMGESAECRDKRECPNCFVLADKDVFYCGECGARLPTLSG